MLGFSWCIRCTRDASGLWGPELDLRWACDICRALYVYFAILGFEEGRCGEVPFWSRRRGADRGSRDNGQDWARFHEKTVELVDFNVVSRDILYFAFSLVFSA